MWVGHGPQPGRARHVRLFSCPPAQELWAVVFEKLGGETLDAPGGVRGPSVVLTGGMQSSAPAGAMCDCKPSQATG